MSDPIPTYQPSCFFYRQELRDARGEKDLLEIALAVVLELERHKEWIRDRGMMPPKFYVTPAERQAKAWGRVYPFPHPGPASETEG